MEEGRRRSERWCKGEEERGSRGRSAVEKGRKNGEEEIEA